ncbi:MAG TPA: DUF4214 domain-containing protein, partial [Gemmataceae bacterium]|nr:DUF4214 domain-containing protein [Gemmataceae bacterium]
MQLFKTFAAAVVVTGLGLGTASAEQCPPPPAVSYAAPAPLPSPQYLGSEDYYQAHGGDPRDYVLALYADVLHRAPSEAEVQHWVAELDQCRDGVTLARDFLVSARAELPAPPPPPVIVVAPPARHDGAR